MVDAIANHELLSFIDTYSEYNQTLMFHKDEEHIAFITDRSFHYYKVMSFGLKNIEAIY